ncbi:MAG TPA: TIM barrel protein [Spirochaetota bacterium]|nr:TIM barrel protein [Spirochaetota bacterium]
MKKGTHMIRLSASTFVYYRYSLDDAIRRTASFGYEGVELWGGRPHAYCEDMSSARVAGLRRLMEDLNISVSNFIPAQFRYPVNIAAPDDDMRRASVDYMKRSIDAAAGLGSPSVSVCPGYSLYGQGRDAAWGAMLESMRALSEHTAGIPVSLLLEPGNRHETDLVITLDDGMRAIRELGRPMGLCVDTGHCFVNAEALSDVVSKTAGMACHYHIDDNNGVTDDHMVPGDGGMHYDIFLSALMTSGYTGFLAVELGFQYTADPDVAVRRSAAFLRKAMGAP